MYLRALATGSAAAFALCAHAQTATVTLSATIDDIGQGSSGPGVVGFFNVGERIDFSFTYNADDSVPPGDDNGFKYVVTSFSIATPAYAATVYNQGAIKFDDGVDADFVGMYTYHDLTDAYGVPLPGVPLLGGYYLSSVRLSLDTLQDALSGDSMNQPLFAEKFDSFSFNFAFREPGTTRLMGVMESRHLNSLASTVGVVPEPATPTLFAVGAITLLLGGLARHRRGRSVAVPEVDGVGARLGQRQRD